MEATFRSPPLGDRRLPTHCGHGRRGLIVSRACLAHRRVYDVPGCPTGCSRPPCGSDSRPPGLLCSTVRFDQSDSPANRQRCADGGPNRSNVLLVVGCSRCGPKRRPGTRFKSLGLAFRRAASSGFDSRGFRLADGKQSCGVRDLRCAFCRPDNVGEDLGESRCSRRQSVCWPDAGDIPPHVFRPHRCVGAAFQDHPGS